MKKAIQPENFSTKLLKNKPNDQPKIGIIPWKKPNINATKIVFRRAIFSFCMEHANETEKQSIARPADNNMMLNNDMFLPKKQEHKSNN